MPNIKLPEGWEIKNVRADGDCFFHAVANGLNTQIITEFPFEKLAQWLQKDVVERNFNAKLLREICHQYAVQQLDLGDESWLKKVIKEDVNRYNSLENYTARISYTAEDIKNDPSSMMLLNLTEVVWGDVIEGKIICSVLNEIVNDSSKEISIHTIEKVDEELREVGYEEEWLHNIINENGNKSLEGYGEEDYKRNRYTIHIINGGHGHFDLVCEANRTPSKK